MIYIPNLPLSQVSALIGCICSGVSLNTAEGFYEFHGTTGLICTGILLLLYLFRIVYRIKIAWYLVVRNVYYYIYKEQVYRIELEG